MLLTITIEGCCTIVYYMPICSHIRIKLLLMKVFVLVWKTFSSPTFQLCQTASNIQN